MSVAKMIHKNLLHKFLQDYRIVIQFKRDVNSFIYTKYLQNICKVVWQQILGEVTDFSSAFPTVYQRM